MLSHGPTESSSTLDSLRNLGPMEFMQLLCFNPTTHSAQSYALKLFQLQFAGNHTSDRTGNSDIGTHSFPVGIMNLFQSLNVLQHSSKQVNYTNATLTRFETKHIGWHLEFGICGSGLFVWERSLGIFRLETFVGDLSLENVRLEISLGNFR